MHGAGCANEPRRPKKSNNRQVWREGNDRHDTSTEAGGGVKVKVKDKLYSKSSCTYAAIHYVKPYIAEVIPRPQLAFLCATCWCEALLEEAVAVLQGHVQHTLNM